MSNCKLFFQNKMWHKSLFIFCIMSFSFSIDSYAQNVRVAINNAMALMGEEKYDEAYSLLQRYTDLQAKEYSDTCFAYYKYAKGSCLYYLKKYEEAIPCLQEGLQLMEKLRLKNCDYLEMMYGIGACYKQLGDYPKAEKYFRKTILKQPDLELNCAIRNQVYSDMAELYSLMGKPEFADICTSRIESEIKITAKNITDQENALWDLYKTHERLEKYDECVNDLEKLRILIKENEGKMNMKYISYSSFMGAHLRYRCNRSQEAGPIHKEIIEISKQFRTYDCLVCNAYADYLRYLSENNKVDSIELILPAAIKYQNNTKDCKETEENLYEAIGLCLCDARNYEEGIKYLEKKWKGQGANSIKGLNYLGLYYLYNKNKPENALGYFQNAQTQIEGGLEVNNGTRVAILENLVYCNQRLGKTNEAAHYFSMLEPLLTNDPNHHSSSLIYWSQECIMSGDINKSEELMSKAEELLEKVSTDEKIRLYLHLGLVYVKSEKPEKAIHFNKEGIDFTVKVKGERCSEMATFYHNLGRAHMLKGDYSTALTTLYKSKDLQLEIEGEVMQRTTDYIKECESK